ncbi:MULTISPECIES: flavin monoamine oxidase family protein [Pseudomonas]|uniref:flavin monoamine oxidase family protein n=1 Tax=Pseudomonas TaxID=286 RepID=UPI0015F8008B|nr:MULTISPECIES: FAD-dependent oxidoreductase [Pseudomonas]MCX2684449.1 FAD-dependent oxidoreductase [Pseudomonas sp. DCB_AW]
MTKQTTHIAIVGAGLSGLHAAYLLQRQGINDFVVLEARDELGGRISSINAEGQAVWHSSTNSTFDRFDLGPTWFWPDYQEELDQLVDALGLERFEQFDAGDMVVERSYEGPAVRMRGYANSPPSMRLVGGMGALVEALLRRVNPRKIVSGQTVRRLRKHDTHVEIDSHAGNGLVTTWRAEHVLLALPPRLLESAIAFEPALPAELARQWRTTATWMAPHAKYIAIYDTPFWRDQGLSGEARSMRGPLGEIHDASMPGGSPALFGFFGVPASTRSKIPDEMLREVCREQLTRMFGPAAATPKAEFIKDWAHDPYTATNADVNAMSQHAAAPCASASSGPWHGCLTGIASEWSPQFPGYLAGAVEAARLGVQALHALAAAPTPCPSRS